MIGHNLVKLCTECHERLKIEQLPERGVPVLYACHNHDCKYYFHPVSRFDLTSEEYEAEVAELPPEPPRKPQQQSLL